MKNRIYKTLVIISVIISCITTAFAGNEVNTGPVRPGCMDDAYKGLENEVKKGNVSEETLYQELLTGSFSPNIVAKFLDDGFVVQYAEELKKQNLLPEEYIIKNNASIKLNYEVSKKKGFYYITGMNKVAIYREPDYTKQIVMYLIRGTKVNVTGLTTTNWYQISVDNVIGYVPMEYLKEKPEISVSENELTYIEADNTSETMILPPTHTYSCVNEQALEALSIFSACGIENEAYINIEEGSKENIIPGVILELTKTNHTDMTICYIDKKQNEKYAITFSDYDIAEELINNYSVDISADYSDGKLQFANNIQLEKPIVIEIAKLEPGEEYNVITDGRTLKETLKASERGTLQITTDKLSTLEFVKSKSKGLTNSNALNIQKVVMKENKANYRMYMVIAISVTALTGIAFIVVILLKKRKGKNRK